ncbi:hypothetical protein ACVWYF_000685 [Hymenobacter sp. UYAg731]
MFSRIFWLCGAVAGLLALHGPAHARQTPNNDGFQRRNGQMQVIRNGQARSMTRDAHLPTGATVTKDGFVVSPTGQRTELGEGQGCDLRGRPVAVRTAANGALALGAPSAPASVRSARPVPAPSLLEQVFGSGDDEGEFKFKKHKKHHGKGHGRGKGDD